MLTPDELDRVAGKLTADSIRASVRRNRLVLQSPQSLATKDLVQYDPFNLLPVFLEKFRGGEGFEFDPSSGMLVSPDGSTVLVIAQPGRPASDLSFARALVTRTRAIDPAAATTGDYAEALEDVAAARCLAALAVVAIALLVPLIAWFVTRNRWTATNSALAAALALAIVCGSAMLLSSGITVGAMPGNEARQRGHDIEAKFGVSGETRTMVVTGTSLDEALDQTAAMTRSLPKGSWSAITQFVPPRAEQLRTIDRLAAGRADGRLSPERIRADFQEALDAEGFRRSAYEDYMALFEQALRASEPMTVEQLQGEQLEMMRDRFIRRTAEGYESLIYVTADLK
jgi:hypothetical protein